MSPNHLLKVDIVEGRNFGSSSDGFYCSALFASEAKETALSSGPTENPVWKTVLQWGVDNKHLRELNSTGNSTCKLTFAASDGRKIGWVVLDLRTARLNHSKKSKKSGGQT